MTTVNSSVCYFGALEAGGTKMVCAIGDHCGNILERISIPTRSPAETMPEMIAFFRQYPIKALGIGCFGPIDLDRDSDTYGYITTTPKLAWQNYPIVEVFREALGVPVGFDTDVNAAALGEATFGCTKDVKNSIYITIGTGVGVGIIVDRKPYHGMIHPEGGHILLGRHPEDTMSDSACPFHNNCLEGLAAGPAIEKRWGRPGAQLANDAKVWQLEAYYIGQAVANYIMLLSPQRIILGGGVMHQKGLLELVRKEALSQLNGYVRGKGLEDPENYIVGASLQDNQGILGSLQLAMEENKSCATF